MTVPCLNRVGEVRIVKFDATIRIYVDGVDVHESVLIESQHDGAQFYVVGKTLPYRDTTVHSIALEGAEIIDVEQPNKHWLIELLKLPVVNDGEQHRFAVIHKTHNMAPMWTATSMHDADELQVTVWYSDRRAHPTWLVNDFPPNLLRGDDIYPVLNEHAEELDVDRTGSVTHTFRNLKIQRSYGMAWTNLAESSND